MDQREKQFQSLNICRRLYNLMKFLARHAHKSIISSSPMPRQIAQAPAGSNEASSKSTQMVQPMAQATPPHEGEQAKTSSNEQDIGGKGASEIERIGASTTVSPTQSEEKKKLEKEATLPPAASQSKAPKKMVSINENIETIKISKKKSKKKKEQEVPDDSKPLKSILKVASDVDNNSDSQSESLLSRANAA